MIMQRTVFSAIGIAMGISSGMQFAPRMAQAAGKKTPEAASQKISAQGAASPSLEGEEVGVWISRSDGALSCGEKEGRPLADDQAELTKAGIQVLKAQKTQDESLRAMMCGIPKGAGNSFLIPSSFLEKAKALGFELKK